MADDEEIICGSRYNAKCVLCISTHTHTWSPQSMSSCQAFQRYNNRQGSGVYLLIELLSTMYYSLTIYTHTSIKRPSRRPYIFQQDRNLPSPAALLLDVRPLLGCWMDSKQIGEAGPALKDRKTLRAGSESGGGEVDRKWGGAMYLLYTQFNCYPQMVDAYMDIDNRGTY
jgi:hypothetical protein